MEPLICPQCGGQITNYSPGQTIATCEYCETKFVIAENKKPAEPPIFEENVSATPNFGLIIGIVIGVVVLVAGGVLISVVSSVRTAVSRIPTITSPSRATTTKTEPTPTPTPELLEFGGKGTGNGFFKDADSLAVDAKGRIYVSDESLRVQQFDDKGQFLKLWQIPSKGANYEHARSIDKVAVAADGKLYVAIGGVVLVYNESATEPSRTIQFAPDYIQDFALRADGGILLVTSNDRIETLLFMNKAGKVTKRLSGFHTNALDAAVSPQETAVAAIRIATDGTGNIFSVYAFGDLGSYSLSSNSEELLIARFSPEGKFVNKFVPSMKSCGIETDSQGRIYISDAVNINIYKNNGDLAGSILGGGQITAFALDKENNVYLLREDKVVKKAAIQ